MKLRTSTIVKGLLASTGLLVGSAAVAMPMMGYGDFREHRYGGPRNSAIGCSRGTCADDKHQPSTVAAASPWAVNGPGVFSATDFGHIGNSAEGLFPRDSISLGRGNHGMTIVAAEAVPSDSSFFKASAVPTSVPEPGMLALFGLGLVGIGFMKRTPRKDSK